MKKYNVGDKVHLKSLKQCKREGIVISISLSRTYTYHIFQNVKYNPGLLDTMINDFGKDYSITHIYSHVVRVNGYTWPYEVIEIPITKLKIL